MIIPPPRTVTFPLAPEKWESLPGYVARVAAHNVHGRTSIIMNEAQCNQGTIGNLQVNQNYNTERLANVLGVQTALIESMKFSPCSNTGARARIDFYGANIPAASLNLRSRQIAPASLCISEHHRALWAHKLIPYCLETKTPLIDRCPSCLTHLRARPESC